MLLFALLACTAAPTLGETGSGSTDGGGTVVGDSGNTDTGPLEGPSPPAVILFIGDGMGFPHLEGGSLRASGGRESLTMQAAPYQARMSTASLSGLTDSAAAATAMATGHKTWNSAVGVDRDLAPLESLLRQAQARGMATGVVTSDSLIGATPASFLAHTSNRSDRDAIIADILAAPPDLLIGGGRSDFGAVADPAVFQLITDAEALSRAAEDGRPLLALLAEDAFEYRADSATAQPTLAELVGLALDRLSDHPEGFFLMVEGARIDHASHAMRSEAVHLETIDFDRAIAAALERGAAWTDRALSVLVTADHECGGLRILEAGSKGEDPQVSWRWGDHTNADVPLLGWGERLAEIDGQRLDNLWVHALLSGAIEGAEAKDPALPRLPDGRFEDLGDRIVRQTQETDFGLGYNQLDAIRLSTDADGLWIGLDGVFDDEANALLVWVDLDLGAGTGVGAELVLHDSDGDLDDLVSRIGFRHELVELGFDAAVGQIGGTYLKRGALAEQAGLRLFSASHGEPDDLWWMDAVLNFGDGSLALGAPAPAAAGTGRTEGGAEILLPWEALFPDGLPAEGSDLAVFAHLVNTNGSLASNQALPPFSSATAPSPSDVPILQVVRVEIDGLGETLTPARLWP